MSKGKIKRLISDRDFGFIQTADRGDLFFHASELQGVDFSSLTVGQALEFEVGQDRSGRLRAVKVRLAQANAQRPNPAKT